MATADAIRQLYKTILGREADEGGLQWYLDTMAGGNMSLYDVAYSMAQSGEAQRAGRGFYTDPSLNDLKNAQAWTQNVISPIQSLVEQRNTPTGAVGAAYQNQIPDYFKQVGKGENANTLMWEGKGGEKVQTWAWETPFMGPEGVRGVVADPSKIPSAKFQGQTGSDYSYGYFAPELEKSIRNLYDTNLRSDAFTADGKIVTGYNDPQNMIASFVNSIPEGYDLPGFSTPVNGQREYWEAGTWTAPKESKGFGGLGGLFGLGAGLLLGPAGLALMPAWGAGAIGGALGSGITGGDPIKGAVLGGLGGWAGGELFGNVADSTTQGLMSGLGDTTADILAGQAGNLTGALPYDQIGALGGNNMGLLQDILDAGSTTITGGGTSGGFSLSDLLGISSGQGFSPATGIGFSPADVFGGALGEATNLEALLAGGGSSVLAAANPGLWDTISNYATQLGVTPTNVLKSIVGGGGTSGVGTTGGFNLGSLFGTGATALGSYLQGKAAQDAAQTAANAQIEAAKIAAEAAKFKPVGVTTRFGSSNFGYDDKGNLISAGYTLTPEMKSQQDALMATSGGLLNQFQGAQAATAPMGTAAQRAMQLGQGYLATDPAAQAAKYMAEQQALLATGRERDLAGLQNKLLQQGRLGLATGGTSTGMMAANPEMEAYYNAIRQQDLGLAAQATQGGMDYTKFGAGMVGTGGDLLKGMYGTQTAAFNPYQTALGGAQTIEGLGQQALDTGINIGAKGSMMAGNAGQLLATGMTNAANTQQQAAYSPWGDLLKVGGAALNQNFGTPQAGGMLNYDPNKYRLTPI